MTITVSDILSSIGLYASDADGLTDAEWSKVSQQFSGQYTAPELKDMYEMVKDLIITRREWGQLINRYKFSASQLKSIFGANGNRLKYVHLAHAALRASNCLLPLSRRERDQVIVEILNLSISENVDISLFLSSLPGHILNNKKLMLPLLESRPQYFALIQPKLAHLPGRLAVEAYKMGITEGQRFPADGKALATVISNRVLADYDRHDPRPLAVIVVSKDDEDDAFRTMGATIDAMSKGYLVRYYEAKTEEEYAFAFKDATRGGKKVSLILKGGHGDQTSIALGAPDPRKGRRISERFYLDIGDASDFRRWRIAKYIAKDAHIIMDSCSNGKGGKDAVNMLNFISRHIPHAYVYALESDGAFKLEFDANGKFIGVTSYYSAKSAVRNWNLRFYKEYAAGVRVPHFSSPTIPTQAEIMRSRKPALETLINDARTSPSIRRAALYELGRSGMASWGSPCVDATMLKVIALAEKYETRTGFNERKWIEAIARFGKRALPLLVMLIKPACFAQYTVYFAIRKIGTNNLFPIAANLFMNTNVETRTYALSLFYDAKDVPMLIRGLRDKDDGVREGTAIFLRRIGDARAARPLIEAYRRARYSKNSDGTTWQVSYALGMLGTPETKAALISALRDRNESIYRRKSAVSALGYTRDARMAPIIAAALRERNKWLVTAALQGLSVLGAVAAPVVPAVIPLLDSREKSIAMGAVSTLGKIGAPARAAIPKLMALYAGETGVNNKRAVIKAIVNIGNVPNTFLPTIIAELKTGLKSNSAFIREWALRMIFKLGPKAAGARADANTLLNDPVKLAPIISRLKEELKPYYYSDTLMDTLWLLDKLGVRAKGAVANVRALLNHFEKSVREQAAITLKAITHP